MSALQKFVTLPLKRKKRTKKGNKFVCVCVPMRRNNIFDRHHRHSNAKEPVPTQRYHYEEVALCNGRRVTIPQLKQILAQEARRPLDPKLEQQRAKMLIFLSNGEQRLITFTLPKSSCTLQEVLTQVNVPFSDDTHIQCMVNTSSKIDYFVAVGTNTPIEEMLENHPLLCLMT